MKFRFVLTLLMSLLLIACKDKLDNASFSDTYRKIPIVDQNSVDADKELAISAEVEKLIAEVNTLSDIFPVEKFIRLEITNDSIVAEITQVLFLRQQWIVRDRIQNQIYKFSEEGKFLGTIGQAGEGPNEYIKAGFLTQINDEWIGVIDGMRGQLLIYDLDGHLMRKTAKIGTASDGGKFPITSAIIWANTGRLYLANFPANSPTMPQHVVLDYSDDQGKALFGFGKRFPLYEGWIYKANMPRMSFAGQFISVGNRIWVGDPYTTALRIYDADGRLYREHRGSHPNGITESDYAEMKPTTDDLRKLNMTKLSNINLIQVKNLIFQQISGGRERYINIYDLNGNRLRTNLKADILYAQSLTGTSSHLVSSLGLLDELDWYDRILTTSEMDLLLQTGWRREAYASENPMLCIRRAAW